MSNFRASINNIMNARNHPGNSLDFPDPATLPTHCVIMDGARINAPQANIVVPVVEDLPAPNITDPALRCGLFNPNAYVRGSTLAVVGKMDGARAMKQAEEERKAKARAGPHISVRANVPYTPAILSEELAAFEELVNEEQLLREDGNEDEATKGKEREGEGEPADLENGGEKTTVEVMEEEGQPGVDAAAFAAAETGQKKHPKKQQKKMQARQAPVGTAWFLQRGKELDSKRIY